MEAYNQVGNVLKLHFADAEFSYFRKPIGNIKPDRNVT